MSYMPTGGMSTRPAHPPGCNSGTINCPSRPGFLNLNTTDILGRCVGSCPVHCRMFSSIPGPTHWVPATPLPVVTDKNIPRRYQCPLRATWPLLRTSAPDSFFFLGNETFDFQLARSRQVKTRRSYKSTLAVRCGHLCVLRTPFSLVSPHLYPHTCIPTGWNTRVVTEAKSLVGHEVGVKC